MVFVKLVLLVTILLQIKNVWLVKMAAFTKLVFAKCVLLLLSSIKIERFVSSMPALKQMLLAAQNAEVPSFYHQIKLVNSRIVSEPIILAAFNVVLSITLKMDNV